jgi:hypothetical protein
MSELVPIPEDFGLDVDQIEQMIFELKGDVSEIARRLNVRSDRVRAFVLASSTLRKAVAETDECAIDKAIGVLHRGLASDSFQNQFYTAKEWLRSGAGKRRGFGGDASPVSIEVKGGQRTIQIKWLDPDTTPEPRTIEGEVGD